jgi:hypothetical protein
MLVSGIFGDDIAETARHISHTIKQDGEQDISLTCHSNHLTN